MAIDSNSVTIDSNSYAIYIPMVRHQVIRKCDKLRFLRAALHKLARNSCDEGSVHEVHNFYLWASIGSPPHLLFRNAGSEAAAHDEKERDRDHDEGRSIADTGVEGRPD